MPNFQHASTVSSSEVSSKGVHGRQAAAAEASTASAEDNSQEKKVELQQQLQELRCRLETAVELNTSLDPHLQLSLDLDELTLNAAFRSVKMLSTCQS